MNSSGREAVPLERLVMRRLKMENEMSIGVLKSVVRHTEKTGGAMTTTPLRKVIKEEVDAGNLIASQARCGPLGILTGEVFLTITERGQEILKGSNLK